MKAIVYTEYGFPEVLQLKEIVKPLPKDNEVLVKVHAASINSWDWDLLTGKTRGKGGRRKPKNHILGSDVAGRIEAVGLNVKQFSKGDEVFGDMCQSGRAGVPIYCGGGFAEYVCASEDSMTKKPTNMTYEQAASIPQTGILALQGLSDKKTIELGSKVLFNGAGGGVGTFGIQIAKSYGAEVTGVDKTGKLDMLYSIGCDHVIDYTKEDFTRNKETYDLIIDVVASRSLSVYKRSLRFGGICVVIGGSNSTAMRSMFFGSFGKKKVNLLIYRPNKGISQLKDLFKAGKLNPVIDKCYSLSEVPEAFKYFGDGNHKGKIVINVV